jgi:hypothetical protein
MRGSLRTNRRVARAWSLCLLAVAAGGAASAQTPAPTLGVLVDQVLALFPKVDGDVLEVQGSTLTLALGRRDGLVAGVELSLYREGRELRHPKTGEVLGRTEQALGRAAVKQVFETYSTGTLVDGGDVRPGDKARVSAGKIRLMLLPLSDGVKDGLVETATYELIEGLGRTGRFQVAMGDAVSVWLGQQGVKRQEVLDGRGLATVGERFKVDNLLVVSFTRVEKKPYMDVRLYTFPGANAILTTALFVPPSIRAAPKGDFSAGKPRDSQTPNQKRSLLARLLSGDLDAGTYSSGESSIPLVEIAKFPFVVLGMDVAVSPQDGIPRMAVTDGERVYLYKIVERVLEAEWTYRPDALGRTFSVQLADLNDDGVLDVVLNRYSPNPTVLLRSMVLTTRDRKPAVLAENIAEILLAVDANGDGIKKTLWGQPFIQKGFFKAGDVLRYRFRNGKLVSDGRVRVPSTFRVTGATLSNIAGKGVRALAYVDELSRFRVAVETEDVWQSSTLVGGGVPKLEVLTNIGLGGRSFLYQPEPLPLSVDLDGDGVEEVVVAQNQFPGRLGVVYKGPAGYRFQTVSSGFEGTVTALGAFSGDGAPVLVLSVVRYYGLLTSAGETQIIITNPE